MKKIIFVLLAAAFVAVEASQSGLGPEFEAFRDVLSHHEETENDTTRDIYAGRRQLQGGAFERSKPLLAATFGGEPGFHHSVASGDPLPDAVIIWTRYTPVKDDDVVTLEFRMAAVDPNLAVAAHLDPKLNPNLKRGLVQVGPSTDWTAKLDMTGLTSSTKYVFSFSDGTRVSDVGTTRTAPAADEDVKEFKYAVFSCSNFPNGYFHAYDVASTIEDLDVWFHVGDFIYEYKYAFSTPGPRIDPILPKWEIVDLQDYRLRYASYIHGDQGLRQLRRAAPTIATWDDHETTNNAWVYGAQNHQPICPANRTSPVKEIDAARCDQDEGDSGVRFQKAFQAYMEWIPVRYQTGSMGQIDTGSFTQVIQWGNLATIVTFDTRISYRSEDPTVGASPLDRFGVFAFQYTNVSAYSDPSSKAYTALSETEAATRKILEDPKYTMIGDYVNLLEETITTSVAAGKPWQIWAANTMVGPSILPDPDLIAAAFASPADQAVARGYLDAAYPTSAAVQIRAVRAMAERNMTSNRDGFDGFSFERKNFLKMMKQKANNVIILGGDVHDSYAWTIYEDGNATGTPVAVNLICPGVTSQGLGGAYVSAFSAIAGVVGMSDLEKAINDASIAQLDGLKFANYFNKGFYAVSVTPKKHTAEYILFTPETIQMNYTAATAKSGKITADSFCAASLETTAGMKGSLEPRGECGAITFSSKRSALFDLPVPLDAGYVGNVATLANCGMKGCSVKVLASTPAPTRVPTPVPTVVPPTRVPTAAPTVVPTPAPTVVPTRAPTTKAPVPAPVIAPVPAPVIAPTFAPIPSIPAPTSSSKPAMAGMGGAGGGGMSSSGKMNKGRNLATIRGVV